MKIQPLVIIIPASFLQDMYTILGQDINIVSFSANRIKHFEIFQRKTVNNVLKGVFSVEIMVFLIF